MNPSSPMLLKKTFSMPVHKVNLLYDLPDYNFYCFVFNILIYNPAEINFRVWLREQSNFFFLIAISLT